VRNIDASTEVKHLISSHHKASLWNDVDIVQWWRRRLLMSVAMRSLVTSYCPLSLLTSALHNRAVASPSYSSPVHDARRPTRNDHSRARHPTIYTTVISRRPLPYLSTAPTTHTHCHAHRLTLTSLTTSLSLVNVVLRCILTTCSITLRKVGNLIYFLD